MEPKKYKTTDLDERADIREDIECAMSLYRFLEEVKHDVSGMQLQMESEIAQAQADCVQIACAWIDLLKEV